MSSDLSFTFYYNRKETSTVRLHLSKPPFNSGAWSLSHDPSSQVTILSCQRVDKTVKASSVSLSTANQWAEGFECRSEGKLADGVFPPTPNWSFCCSVDHRDLKSRWDWQATLTIVAPPGSLGSGEPEVNSAAPKLVAARNAHYLMASASNDVVFTFPRPNRELWANSKSLKKASPYFAALFEAGFSESGPSRPGRSAPSGLSEDNVLARDSDDETDQVPTEPSAARTAASITSGAKQVVINSTSYTTYRSVLTWLHSGFIAFAPLTTAPFATEPSSSQPPAKRARLESAAKSDPDLPLPASPKSVYQLAHLLELPDLMKLALDNFKSQLAVGNVLYQLTAEVAVHDEVRAAIVDFIEANSAAVKASKAATELGKAEVLEALGCGAEVAARFMEVFSKC